jgi:MFS family permease
MFSVQAVTALAITAALVYGMALALLAILKEALARRLQLSEGRIGRLLVLFNLMLAPFVLLAGILVDHVGVRPVLMLGSVILSMAVFALGLTSGRKRAFAALLAAALGAAGLSTSAVVLMPPAFFGPLEMAASLSLGHVFVALGALLTPPLFDLLLRALDLRRALALLAVLCLVPAFVAVVPPTEQFEAGGPHGAAFDLIGRAPLWLAALVLFCYAPFEASVSAWVAGLTRAENAENPPAPPPTATEPTVVKRSAKRRGPLLAPAVLFWGSFLSARLVVALGQHAGWLPEGLDTWVLVLPSLLAAVVIGNLAGAGDRGSTGLALVVLGILLGPAFPALLAVVFRHVAPAEQGTAYGAMFVLGSLGSLLLSPLIRVRPANPASVALRVPLLLALLLTASALVFGLLVHQ